MSGAALAPGLLGQMLAVGIGGAIGAVLRWAVGLWLAGTWSAFPIGTLLVNCVGGLAIGFALVAFDRVPAEALRLLLVTGFLGGLTTFSAFSAESLVLVQRGQLALALVHTAAHVAGALGCAALGWKIGRFAFG